MDLPSEYDALKSEYTQLLGSREVLLIDRIIKDSTLLLWLAFYYTRVSGKSAQFAQQIWESKSQFLQIYPQIFV